MYREKKNCLTKGACHKIRMCWFLVFFTQTLVTVINSNICMKQNVGMWKNNIQNEDSDIKVRVKQFGRE